MYSGEKLSPECVRSKIWLHLFKKENKIGASEKICGDIIKKSEKLCFLLLSLAGMLLIVSVLFAAVVATDREHIASLSAGKENSTINSYGENGVILEVYDPGVVVDTAQEVIPGSEEPVVNINTASAEELDAALPGIGPVKAAAIIEYRTLVGGFSSVWELIEVEGIGENTLKEIVPHCTVE